MLQVRAAQPAAKPARDGAEARGMCAAQCGGIAMDRLFATPLPVVTDELLRRLADADRSVARWARRRRRSVEITVVAGLSCWAAQRLALPKTGGETILFLVCSVAAIGIAVVERRVRHARERLAARLAAERAR